MRTMNLIIALLGCLVSTAPSANNYTQSPERMRGASTNTLINEWGQPDMKIISRSGTTFYIYKTRVYKGYIPPPPASPSIGINNATGRPVIVTEPQPNMNTLMPGPESLYCDTIFEANKQGKIVSIQVKGTGC